MQTELKKMVQQMPCRSFDRRRTALLAGVAGAIAAMFVAFSIVKKPH